MKNIKIITATEARKNFFKLLDEVINGKSVYYISKDGKNSNVKISLGTENTTEFDWNYYDGYLADKDADELERIIDENKRQRLIQREAPQFD